jgi:hypothetical protein
MEDERLVVGNTQEFGEVRLGSPNVDERVAVVAEDAERAVEMEVHGGWLQIAWVVRADGDLAGFEGGTNVAVREDAHVRLT